MGKIIAFANQKGGVGKTTTCVNVAAFLAMMGKKVLLVDVDPQGNATTGLGVKKTRDSKSIYNAIVGEISLAEIVTTSIVPNLDVAPANIDLAGVEVEMVHMQDREQVIKKLFNTVIDSYDYITIDCPPSLGLLTINALTASDSILIPIQCEFFPLEGLSQLMNTVRLVKKHLNPDLAIEGAVLTMRDGRSNLGNQVAEEIEKYFGPTLFKTAIPRNVRLAEAPSHGLPVYVYDKSCPGSDSYMKLTEELLKRNKDSYKRITKAKTKEILKTKGARK